MYVCVCACVCVCVWGGGGLVLQLTLLDGFFTSKVITITYSAVQCFNSIVHIQMLGPLFAAFLCGVSFCPIVNISHLSIGVGNTVLGNKGQNSFVVLQKLQHNYYCMELMQSSKDLNPEICTHTNFHLLHNIAKLGG